MFIQCSNLIATNPPRMHYGMAVGDVDGDGRDEIVITGFDGPNRVLKWDGSGLVDLDIPALADPTARAVGVALGDFDGDGREDVYILNTDTYGGAKGVGDRLFTGFGARWIDLFTQAENWGAANRHSGRSVAVIDREGTGRYGFVVAGFGGPLKLYEMGPRGRIRDVAEEVGLDAVVSARSLLTAPLLGDRPDIVVGCELGPNLLFRNTGDGEFEELGHERGIADPGGNTRGIALLEGDGGLADLVVATWNGANRLFQQRPGGGFADVAPPELAAPGKVRTVIVADFDNDGYEEIFLNLEGEANRLFAWREDRWVQIDIGDAAEPGGLGTAAIVADLDGDGQLELLIAHGETAPQPLSLHIAEPRGNHWLRVRPLTRAGAPARGAVVRLTAGGRTQHRAIDGGSGYLCQMEPVAHFGLGDLTAVERVEVRWPDGTSLTLPTPATCQTLVVPHP
jgi:hypothetical protein